MSNLSVVCGNCAAAINTVFNAATGTRTLEIIAGDLVVTDPCFIRDEIRFLNGGRLIFGPNNGRYENEKPYVVFCRKLVIVGGNKPVTLNPCGPDDPGGDYASNNVITWQDRLTSAKAGAGYTASAADATTVWNRNNWQDKGQGNDGKEGGAGDPGAKGHNGDPGKPAPPRGLVLVALEVEAGIGDHLTVDWDGQTGGNGGRGQRGGNGGNGMGGRDGQSDTSWPGTGCDRQPGNGGPGGPGGAGGAGGDGGKGGDAAKIVVISTHANNTSGALGNGTVTYVNDGGTGGKGGSSNVGGAGGLGGFAGRKTSLCDAANDGANGAPGQPETLLAPDSDPGLGTPGAHGAASTVTFEDLDVKTCAALLPVPMRFDTTGLPVAICRGNSTPATADVSFTGDHLAQAKSVTSSLANITATIKASSTDTQIDLKLQVAGNSGLGTGDLIFKPVFGSDQTLAGAISVSKFDVTGVVPSSGAKGASVNVTISGHCFDPSALIQQVTVSGLGVNVLNVVVVDDHTINCVFDIAALAASTARDVTVKTGAFSYTLANGFTVL